MEGFCIYGGMAKKEDLMENAADSGVLCGCIGCYSLYMSETYYRTEFGRHFGNEGGGLDIKSSKQSFDRPV